MDDSTNFVATIQFESRYGKLSESDAEDMRRRLSNWINELYNEQLTDNRKHFGLHTSIVDWKVEVK